MVYIKSDEFNLVEVLSLFGKTRSRRNLKRRQEQPNATVRKMFEETVGLMN